MKSLKTLHESFIKNAQRPMALGRLPITPQQQPEVPLVATDRWAKDEGSLTKTFQFRRINDRETFITELLAYERDTQHHARIAIDHDRVTVKLSTKELQKVTESDKDYATFADVLYKDVVYSVSCYGDES